MLLIAAIALLGLVVIVGTWLAGRQLMAETPRAGPLWVGVLHGLGGAAGFAILVAALRGSPASPHAARMGAGAFGLVAGGLLAATLSAGLVILATRLRGRALPIAMVATHGMLGITGYTLLVTYLTTLR